jgi:hypothetical protein
MVWPRRNLLWRAKLAGEPRRSPRQLQRINPIAFQAAKCPPAPCGYRHHLCLSKSNPDILVVQPAENWAAKNLPSPFDGARERRILLQGEMRARAIVIFHV